MKISNLSLNEAQHALVNDLFYTVSNIERIGDHAENLAELAKFKMENDLEFSETASKDLEDIMELVNNSVVCSIKARSDQNLADAQRAREFEDRVDNLEEELRQKHIERLTQGLCKPAAGVVFLDILTNLERISDHADNIAEYILDEA